MVNANQLIRTNKVFGGSLKSKNSLDYGVERANEEKNVYRKLSYIVRSMTSDHAFWDGNKRTAIVSVLSEFEDEGIKCDERKLTVLMVKLAKENTSDINKIEKELRRCSRR